MQDRVSVTAMTEKEARWIFKGMPFEEQLIKLTVKLMLLRRAIDFCTLLEDLEFSSLLWSLLRKVAETTVRRELYSKGLYLPESEEKEAVEKLHGYILVATLRYDPSCGLSLVRYLSGYLNKVKEIIAESITKIYYEVNESDLLQEFDEEEDGNGLSSEFEFCDNRSNPEEIVIYRDLKQKLLREIPQKRRKTWKIAKELLEEPYSKPSGKMQRHRARRVLQQSLLRLDPEFFVNQQRGVEQ